MLISWGAASFMSGQCWLSETAQGHVNGVRTTCSVTCWAANRAGTLSAMVVNQPAGPGGQRWRRFPVPPRRPRKRLTRRCRGLVPSVPPAWPAGSTRTPRPASGRGPAGRRRGLGRFAHGTGLAAAARGSGRLLRSRRSQHRSRHAARGSAAAHRRLLCCGDGRPRIRGAGSLPPQQMLPAATPSAVLTLHTPVSGSSSSTRSAASRSPAIAATTERACSKPVAIRKVGARP